MIKLKNAWQTTIEQDSEKFIKKPQLFVIFYLPNAIVRTVQA